MGTVGDLRGGRALFGARAAAADTAIEYPERRSRGAREPAVAIAWTRVTDVVRVRSWAVVVWGSMLAWAAVLFVVARSNYLDFRYGRFDLGNMVQAVWSTAHGHPLEVTDVSTGEQMVRLGSHVDPVLALFAPVWLVWPSPLALAFAQIAAVALGALPVFWLARRHLGSDGLASLLALAYLAYPWLAWTALDAIHPVTLAIPLLLYGIWFLDSDRVLAFAPFAVLAALTGELMGVTIAALGLWFAFARQRRLAGFAIAACGLAWSAVALEVVVPAFRGGPSIFYGYYATVGGSPEGVLRTAFTHPAVIVSALLSARDVDYLLLLALPLAGLFVLAPALAAVAVPQLLANGLSDTHATTSPSQHYIAAVLPFLVAATVVGLSRLSARWRTGAAMAVLTLSVGVSALLGPWQGVTGVTPPWSATQSSPSRADVLRKALAFVPAGAPVSATNRAASQLSARRYVYSAPVIGRARWIVLDTRSPWRGTSESLVAAQSPDLTGFGLRVERSSRWTKVFDEDGVLVFRRA